jgi:hypothetical protein
LFGVPDRDIPILKAKALRRFRRRHQTPLIARFSKEGENEEIPRAMDPEADI